MAFNCLWIAWLCILAGAVVACGGGEAGLDSAAMVEMEDQAVPVSHAGRVFIVDDIIAASWKKV